jgi:soluble lytic murein transglycosylase-like protein
MSAFGQQNPDAVRAAMQRSLETQSASVRKQVMGASASAAQAGFFVVDWPSPRAIAAGVPDCDPLPQPVVNHLVNETAVREGLDPKLVKEVARRESGFRPCAVSAKGAVGFMQLMPETADQLGVRDPFDVRENLSAGTRFLKQMLDRYQGDIALALGAYNAGPGRIDRAGGIPPIPETQRYVKDILANMAPP